MLSVQNNIILLLILLGLSAFFSGSETALTFIDNHRVRFLYEKKKFGSKALKRLKDDSQRMLITILIGNNLVNITASVMATALAYTLFESHAVSISIGVMTFLILVFGEILPKTMATKYNERIALSVADIIWAFSVVLLPITRLWQTLDSAVSKEKKRPFITEEELKTIVDVGQKEGTIKEAELIHKIFKFDDIPVKDVMTPKIDMTIISSDKKIKDVVKLCVDSNYSRIPVYEKTRDNIVGIVYIKDVLKKIDHPNMKVTEIMDKAIFVPETKKTDELLHHFQKRKKNIAIVVNEHGSVIGLITLEDLIEEIVGEIIDETEKIEPEIREVGKKTWIVQGKTDIEDVNDALRLKLKEERDFSTIGGFILDKLGKIPKEGEEFKIDSLTMKILRREGLRIDEIRITKK